MIEKEADINAVNHENNTPHTIARSHCKEDIVNVLMEYEKSLRSNNGGAQLTGAEEHDHEDEQEHTEEDESSIPPTEQQGQNILTNSNNRDAQLSEAAEYSPIVVGLMVLGVICCMVRPIRMVVTAAVKCLEADKRPQGKMVLRLQQQQGQIKEKKSQEDTQPPVLSQQEIVKKEAQLVATKEVPRYSGKPKTKQPVDIKKVSQKEKIKEKKSQEAIQKSALLQLEKEDDKQKKVAPQALKSG